MAAGGAVHVLPGRHGARIGTGLGRLAGDRGLVQVVAGNGSHIHAASNEPHLRPPADPLSPEKDKGAIYFIGTIH